MYSGLELFCIRILQIVILSPKLTQMSRMLIDRAAVGMGIPMGMVWVWGL